MRLLLLSTLASPPAPGSNSVPWKSSLVDPPARRKFTAFVVRETLDAFAVAVDDPPVCANIGAVPNPRIPVTTRQIIAFFTLVLPFAASDHISGRSSTPTRSAFGPVLVRLSVPLPSRSHTIKCLRDFRLAETPHHAT